MPEVMEQPMDVQMNKLEDSTAQSQRNATEDETKPSPSPSSHKESAVPAGLSPEKRLGLITAMGQFRPKTATPIQFYNFVREFCIMHNCSIDEAMERAPLAWMELSKAQTRLYNSEMHAALPIPVPHHLIYRAIQMERAGHWKLASMPPTKGSCGSKYTVESFVPPPKPPKIRKHLARINQRPRWDNLAETSPCYINIPKARTLPPLPSAERKVRTLTPPEQRAQLAQKTKSAVSLTRILTQTSLKGQQGRNKRARINHLKPTKSSMAKCIKLPQETEPQEIKKPPKLPKLPKVKKVVKKVSSVTSKTDKLEKPNRVSCPKKKLKKT